MKILHVVRGLPNSSGTTHIVNPLAEAQARNGHEVSIFAVKLPGESSVTADSTLVRTEIFSLSLPFYHPGISFAFAQAIKHRLRDFDVVHIHAIWNFPTWQTMRQAVRQNVPFLVAPQGSLEPWARAWHARRKAIYARFVELPLMNKANRMQALSPAEAGQIKAAGITARTVQIPNGVDLEAFDAAPRATLEHMSLPEDRPLLLSLSRLDPKKGIDILIRGFAQYAGEGGPVDLVIAGQDNGSGYGAYLESLAAEFGCSGRIHFIGEVRGAEKTALLDRADAFALISHSEGLPVAVVEAMAAFLPVIITPNCNIPEVTECGAGLIAETDSVQVAQALSNVFSVNEHNRQMGRNGRLLVEDRFTWPKIAEHTAIIYRQMIDEKRAQR